MFWLFHADIRSREKSSSAITLDKGLKLEFEEELSMKFIVQMNNLTTNEEFSRFH
jgi:hypothetical protein